MAQSATTKDVRKDGRDSLNRRSLFLSSLGFIHLVAFASYYASFPGLLSESGIEPAKRVFPYAEPWIQEHFVWTGIIDEDSICELLALLGMALASLVTLGIFHHASIFGVMTCLYSLHIRSGGNFYMFQWDILLMETSFVTALCVAPWHDGPLLGAWPVRFLLFKLMYMSGIVKIQADCPTWLNLTALEYHFATQCLPGPLSWHAHQIHPFLLRFSVATTLWIEIPVAFCLLAPTVTIRRVGARLQILLQTMIVLTGNYNFFNLLTMILCIPCFEPDTPHHHNNNNNNTERKRNKRAVLWEQLFVWAFLVWSFFAMFAFQVHGNDTWRGLNIVLKISKQDCDRLSGAVLPLVILYVWVMIFGHAVRTCRSRPSNLVCAVVCMWAIGFESIPMLTTLGLPKNGFLGSSRIFEPMWRKYAQPYHLSNGYGLFRRMTGVGTVSSLATGWAGLPPSVVKRPEIVLEGIFDDDPSEEWMELDFRWKPGNPYELPRQMAPHQPRLDWQMWFAALGAIRHNPWFIHLVKKILDGCPPVLDMMNDARLNKGRKLKLLRARLYHYDFTRLPFEWNQQIPGVELTNSSDAWASQFFRWPEKVWSRTFSGTLYLPPMEPKNEQIENYLTGHAYTSVCYSDLERCSKPASNNIWCRISARLRIYKFYLVFPLSVFVVLLARFARGFWLERSSTATNNAAAVPEQTETSKEKTE